MSYAAKVFCSIQEQQHMTYPQLQQLYGTHEDKGVLKDALSWLLEHKLIEGSRAVGYRILPRYGTPSHTLKEFMADVQMVMLEQNTTKDDLLSPTSEVLFGEYNHQGIPGILVFIPHARLNS